jgi:hypothetical protein
MITLTKRTTKKMARKQRESRPQQQTEDDRSKLLWGIPLTLMGAGAIGSGGAYIGATSASETVAGLAVRADHFEERSKYLDVKLENLMSATASLSTDVAKMSANVAVLASNQAEIKTTVLKASEDRYTRTNHNDYDGLVVKPLIMIVDKNSQQIQTILSRLEMIEWQAANKSPQRK